MKNRIILTALVLTIFSFAGHAQVFSYGAKLGLGFPGFIDEEIASQRMTLAIKLTGSLNITRSLQFQIDAGYQRKGNKFTYQVWDNQNIPIEDSSYVVKTNLDYITIPAIIKVNLGSANKFYFQAGAYYGYLLNAKFTGKYNHEMVKRLPIKSGLSANDFGLVAGGGIETPIRQGLNVMLDVRYQYGLKDLNLDPTITGQAKPILNKGLVMSMGIMIDLE